MCRCIIPAEDVMSTLYRAQLLLESEQHKALAEIAEQEGRSISDLVREIVRRHLAERGQEAEILSALQAIEGLTQIRTKLREEHGICQGDPLAEVRAEWEADVERISRGET
jgi:Arc/MetJ-type ribon-helix-helix transcriptional regulator